LDGDAGAGGGIVAGLIELRRRLGGIVFGRRRTQNRGNGGAVFVMIVVMCGRVRNKTLERRRVDREFTGLKGSTYFCRFGRIFGDLI
jgi:hypothetical protein